MKKASILLIALSLAFTQKPCPKEGDSPNGRIRALNILKNRDIIKSVGQVVGISDILKPGNDSLRWSSSSFVSVTGYIILVKYGRAETCNCHSLDKTVWDVHIELAANPTDKSSQAMVCEAGANSRVYDPSLTIENIRKLKGKKVTITGYLFPDSEHWQNSVNINPSGTDLWRGTEWEIHPIASIELSK